MLLIGNRCINVVALRFMAGKLVEWRWGSVVASTEKMLDVQIPLRRFWSLQKYQAGGTAPKRKRVGTEADPEAHGDASKFDLAVRSDRMWAFCSVAQTLVFAVRCSKTVHGERQRVVPCSRELHFEQHCEHPL